MPGQLTPDQALAQLLRGNERFAAGRPDHPNQSALRRREVSDSGQQPFAIVLSCADSRVPPEIIFDQGLGDLFVIRVAGNVLDDIST
jgi:carbonic anhydrase